MHMSDISFAVNMLISGGGMFSQRYLRQVSSTLVISVLFVNTAIK